MSPGSWSRRPRRQRDDADRRPIRGAALGPARRPPPDVHDLGQLGVVPAAEQLGVEAPEPVLVGARGESAEPIRRFTSANGSAHPFGSRGGGAVRTQAPHPADAHPEDSAAPPDRTPPLRGAASSSDRGGAARGRRPPAPGCAAAGRRPRSAWSAWRRGSRTRAAAPAARAGDERRRRLGRLEDVQEVLAVAELHRRAEGIRSVRQRAPARPSRRPSTTASSPRPFSSAMVELAEGGVGDAAGHRHLTGIGRARRAVDRRPRRGGTSPSAA